MTSPWPLLREWLPANDDPARPLMTLITATPDGVPDGRAVLLSEYDESGFYFHTDSRSRKIAAIDANPHVALVIVLVEERHQITVQGVAETAGAEEELRAYARRSDYLRTLAWLNTQEFAVMPEVERVAVWAAFVASHPEPDPPDTWTGRRVRPTRITLWTGRGDTCSRREEFTLAPDGTWSAGVLAG